MQMKKRLFTLEQWPLSVRLSVFFVCIELVVRIQKIDLTIWLKSIHIAQLKLWFSTLYNMHLETTSKYLFETE